jgi:hypothetical protein
MQRLSTLAFLITLETFDTLHLKNPLERSRHAASLSLAYKRVANLNI